MSINVDGRIAWLNKAIASISDELKGPMSNLERSMLHLDRKDLRTELTGLLFAPLSAKRSPTLKLCRNPNHDPP